MSHKGLPGGFWLVTTPASTAAEDMKRPNPLPTEQMTPAERRAELCGLLSLGLVRLRMPDRAEVSDKNGESCLHSLADEWRHATSTHRRNA